MPSEFTNREYYEMVRVYLLSNESLQAARMMYAAESVPRLRAHGIQNPSVPNERTILAANQRLLDHGQFRTPSHAQGSGRPRLSVDVEDSVLEFFERDPRASTYDAARRFGVSPSTVWRLLNSAGLHPYHFQPVQSLHVADAAQRRAFCEWLLNHQDVNILWTDESLFTRVGLYNIHNEHWWAFNNPHLVRENHHQVRFSANVWAGIINNKIIGPVFIDGTLTGPKYLDMLQNTIEGLLDRVPLAYYSNLYYQHDGAPPHYTREVRNFLNNKYGERWIGRGGPIPWPARSPDLTVCDFYLWNEIKRRVYVEEARDVDDLKSKIIEAFNEVKRDTVILNKLKENILKRARLCLERDGLHFEQYLKYS